MRDKSLAVQERLEVERKIAEKGLSIFYNPHSELVQRYWELVREINR